MTISTLWTQLRPFLRWLPACAMLLMSLSYLYNLVYQVQELRRAQSQHELRRAEVAKNEKILMNWRSALEYAKTDYFTERYARTELRMGKSGDVIVFPYAPQASPDAGPSVRPNIVWWNDFVE
ncbi:MAG: hypothetical protein KIH69_014890 [Anaerolineae bacterium]|nr:hypothetical protein [Anaerolineae bacterium]